MDTLVLSAWYEPVARISWQRAITLLFAGKVEVVDEYQDREIRSTHISIKMPAVVRFLRTLRNRKQGVRFSRENVYLRDQGRCQYCAHSVSRAVATYDHVLPRTQGGRTSWENVVICCVPCNQQKGGRTPAQAKMALRSVPVKPKKLADTLRVRIAFNDGMPQSWRNWLRDFSYWNGELDTDGD
jgi:5-methylcytosine-specific restriction endonuclease McrA